MKQILIKITVSLLALSLLTGCARDLSSSTYTSDSTLNIALKGRIISKRDVKVSETERLGDNTTGAMAGALAGGLGAANSNNSGVVVAGGAILGGVAGAAVQSALGTSRGTEYIVEIDRSQLLDDYYEGSRLLRNSVAAIRATGLITIIQAKENKKEPVLSEGQSVLVILSEKRSRLIPASY